MGARTKPKRFAIRRSLSRLVRGVILGLTVFAVTLAAVTLMRPATQSGATPANTRLATRPDPVAAMQRRANASPRDPRAWALLGMAYLGKARTTADPSWYSQADRALQKSLQISSTANPDAFIGLSALASARHSFVDALSWAQKAAKAGGDTLAVNAVLGDALVELGRYQDAFAVFDQMIAQRPNLSSYARVSYARELQGDVQGAVRGMELALRTAGSDEDKAFVASQLGDLHWNAGRFAPARRAYELALQHQPTLVAARAGLAKVAAATGNYDDAMSRYEKIVNVVPLPEHVVSLHDLYVKAGRADKAEQMLELIDVQRRLLAAGGVNVDVEWAVIAADFNLGVENAVATLRSEWKLRKSVAVADAMAWALHALDQSAEALVFAEHAVRLGTRQSLLYFHKAMIEKALGDRAAAVQDFRTALQINPEFSVRWAPVAKAALKELR